MKCSLKTLKLLSTAFKSSSSGYHNFKPSGQDLLAPSCRGLLLAWTASRKEMSPDKGESQMDRVGQLAKYSEYTYLTKSHKISQVSTCHFNFTVLHGAPLVLTCGCNASLIWWRSQPQSLQWQIWLSLGRELGQEPLPCILFTEEDGGRQWV